MIKDAMEVLKEIKRNPLRVYMGDGYFGDLGVKLFPGLTTDECNKLPTGLPPDYIDLLSFSNGFIFYDSGDFKFNITCREFSLLYR